MIRKILKLNKTLLCSLILFTTSTLKAESTHVELNVNYVTGKSNVKEKDLYLVEQFATYTKNLSDIKIVISGHTDTVGTYNTNLVLSKRRAKDLKALLISYGVDPEYIDTKWYSYNKPIASNETPEGRQQNRRTNTRIYGLSKNEIAEIPEKIKSARSFSIGESNVDEIEPSSEMKPSKYTPPEQDPTQPFDTQSNADETDQEDISEPIKGSNKSDELVETTKEDEKESDYKDRYYVGWSVLDSELTASRPGFQATWITEFIHSFSGAYQFKLSENFWLGASGAYRLQDYRNEDNPIYTWDEDTPDILKASIALDYEPSKKWGLGLDLTYREEAYVITDVLNISLEKAALIETSFRGLYKFYENQKYSARVNGSLDLPLSSSDSIEPEGSLSFQAGVDFSFLKLIKNYELNIGASFARRNLENIQNEQDENYLDFHVRLRSRNWL